MKREDRAANPPLTRAARDGGTCILHLAFLAHDWSGFTPLPGALINSSRPILRREEGIDGIVVQIRQGLAAERIP